MRTKRTRPTVTERFWAKVNKTDTCWLWTAGTSVEGYGRFRLNDRSRKAHQVSYEMHVGPIPEGKVLDHLCRVPGCVNPAHLEPVTDRENILRGTAPAAVNAAKTHCKRGHEFTDDNTYWSKGKRSCKTCSAAHDKAYKAARRKAKEASNV